jgi:hypothetical protein
MPRGKRLWGKEAKRTNRLLCIRHAKKFHIAMLIIEIEIPT